MDLDTETLLLAVNVTKADEDVAADALQRLEGQRTPQVLDVGTTCWQAEPIPTGNRGNDNIVLGSFDM